MRRAFLAALCLAAGGHAAMFAQQANQNIDVLPVVLPSGLESGQVLDAALKGDLFANRQLEPAIAVSTRNPSHLIAFFNDYRAVDIPDDIGLGETQNTAGAFAAIGRFFQGLWARVSRAPADRPALPAQAAASEAWIGMSRSDDGGITWSGGLLPGALFDDSPASIAAPVYGLEAATDPVVSAAPCGRFYLAFVAFTRGGQSKIAVARYVDHNDLQGGETIFYEGMTILESGNNATHGYFLDKPSIAVDVDRGAGAGCGHKVYVGYTTFNGLEKDGKFKSKVNFARSVDGGATFSTQKLNMPYNQGQGTAITVDPEPGTPSTTGGGTVYLVWRHFFNPDTILLHRSTNYGQTFPGQPIPLTSGAAPVLATFDQPTIPTGGAPPSQIAFRSNAFPTAAVTADGTLFAAWQERVDIDPASPTFRQPLAGGSPRIVVTRSVDGGVSWSPRQAVDVFDRDAPGFAPSPGLGLLPQPRAAGPQVMPKLIFGGGRLMLLYYESRGLLVQSPEQIVATDITPPAPGFISGIDRLLDVRAALLDPATGAVLGSAQVSRYPIKAGAQLEDGEQVSDIQPVNAPCTPDYPTGPPCVRRLNRAGTPHSAAGSSPFMGDYIEASQALQFVPNETQTGWRWATGAADVPYSGFHAIFTDNRNQQPPTFPGSLFEAQRYPFYGPPGTGGACVNAGSRDADVFTSHINAELVVSTPTTFKQLEGIQRAFPIQTANATDVDRFYRLTFATPAMAAIASFAQEDPAVDTVDVHLLPYSTATRVVYVDPVGANQPVKVLVQEIDGLEGAVVVGGAGGSATFNGDASNPFVKNAEIENAETQNPFVTNPFVVNYTAENPFVKNQSPSNPFVRNPFVKNSFIDDASVTVYEAWDVTWAVANLGNDIGAYLSLINIDNPDAYVGSYAFQLLIYKTSLNGGVSGCEAYNVAQDQILSNLTADPSASNPFVKNPFVRNSFAENPFVKNPFVTNATFTVAPSDEGENSHDGTKHAPRNLHPPVPPDPADPSQDTVRVTLRVLRIADGPGVPPFDPEVDPPSLAVVSISKNNVGGVLEDAVAALGPDLVVTEAPAEILIPVAAGGTVEVGVFTVANSGPGTAEAESSSFTHRFYLSSDAEFDTGDVPLTVSPTPSSTSLAGGAEESFGPVTVTIPDDAPLGSAYLILFVDDGREVSEFDETNNFVVLPITIVGGNVAPEAQDGAVVTAEDTPVAVTLSATDANGDGLTFTIVSGPTSGVLSGSGASRTYTPAANYFGSDSFTFSASDGALDSNVATVSITISPVNDAPLAQPDSVTIAQNAGAQIIDVLANDSDVDGGALSVAAVTQPASGTAALTAGVVSYTPGPNFTGTETFTYTVSDGNGGSTVGVVTVHVTDSVADYGFLGLQSPWKAAPTYTAKIGSSVPLVWQYTIGGLVVNSGDALPEIRIRGPFDCGAAETAGTLEFLASPGNSGFQYFTSSNTWQFNWQTAGPAVTPGCYNVRVFSHKTRQLNGPFLVRLRR